MCAASGESPIGLTKRVLGLDVGSKRIGIAISDPLGITAQGLETLQRQNKRLDFEKLAKLARDYEVAEIVVGFPLRMSGVEGIQAEKMQIFAEELRKHLQLPVHLWDERLTSAEANRLLRETDMSIKRRGQVVDQMAAVLILQSWMEHRAQANRTARVTARWGTGRSGATGPNSFKVALTRVHRLSFNWEACQFI
jgi:putative holliday junction resolvase